ncbi:MAG: DUF1015 family protein [Verrucomicrobiota bacterium]|nr:DUF1015 family protein [Verrucomicrobiota bacterium]
MADVRPFAAVRARPELAGRICCPPYDVLSIQEARVLAEANPDSFVRVTRAEVDFAGEPDPHCAKVYERARSNFLLMIGNGLLIQDSRPWYYVYRLTMGERSQTGLAALVSCSDYQNGIVRAHELTRTEKEDDRARHIEVVGAQTGPAFLVYRAMPELDGVLAEVASLAAETSFVDDSGVRHEVWVIGDETVAGRVREITGRLQRLYIADGHHRTAAALRVSELMKGAGGSGGFLAVLFPHNQLEIMPYNRVLRDLNGQTPARVVARLAEVMELIDRPQGTQPRLHEVDLYLSGGWHRFRFRTLPDGGTDPLKNLDVVLLQEQVLDPVFGIGDPRRDDRIGFVGGIRGVDELVRLVNSGEYVCAFAMHPTRIDDMMAIADSGRLLPPKSTWFEPKLRDGLFTHRFNLPDASPL